ncbi:MAG: type II secretion system minor pseudopilin GspJ [Pacificimonas sp.]
MTDKPASSGFTLVETLVALFIFGLLASAGAYTLGVSVESAQAVEEVSDQLQDLQRSRAALRADLAQMTPRRGRGMDGAARSVLTGGENAPVLLAFTRFGPDNPDAAARPSLQYVEYRMTDAGLERRAAAQLDGAVPVASLLLPGAAAAEIDFHYEGAWSDTPLAAPAGSVAPLPDAIRLNVSHPRFGRVEQLFLVGAA